MLPVVRQGRPVSSPGSEAGPTVDAPVALVAPPIPASASRIASPGECRLLRFIWAGAAAPGRDYDGPKLAVDSFALFRR